ncbi:hypothetical protein SAICODRAFT_22003 [Saitoella complicata NRRL Y-17804]|uniref:Uncharacterized protein n=1 Tax=Saitoella complicata (strain BCRC 22490 / CBS 7301 / JCM 7358 / NBRC 10748 / NRRL Y-17804) TaxID=698492 RepID=A0A0E9NJ40_SAICN|nr:uncharacterized protein SAICODRAFT_22003 [Saitoella complicata NRRL Y-17804]ODQ50025.1 hypothetical protein SAICODRAFT_22003 [Saitoella complicata NRRL Y-17804]GAO49716.1 hypothetical protein G7K_3860-t1 [Saitoella complicata NRRL Y-17804]
MATLQSIRADYTSDSAYRKYAKEVDRVLGTWDTDIQEWADHIAFLGRLLKALQLHPSIPRIPSPLLTSSRLAQCLSPHLPSGVHLRALEVYSYIFSKIGRDGLATSFTLYWPGLAPVPSYASSAVKDSLLSLIAIFIPPLGPALMDSLPSVLLGLFLVSPDDLGDVLPILEAVREGCGSELCWWSTIWSLAREGRCGLNLVTYLSNNLPSLASTESLHYANIFGPDKSVPIRGLCGGLQDESSLVQRGFLDLLIHKVPLSCELLQDDRPDLALLTAKVAAVLLRRDSSLNRRVWTWFIGPRTSHDPDTEPQTPSTSTAVEAGELYFRTYGLDTFLTGFRFDILPSSTPTTPLSSDTIIRATRILIGMMDHPEIRCSIPPLFTHVMRAVYLYKGEHEKEVLDTARMFFDQVEARVVWAQLLEWLAWKEGEEHQEQVELARWVLGSFDVTGEEMRDHLVRVAYIILRSLVCSPGDDAGMWAVGEDLARLLQAEALATGDPEQGAVDLSTDEVVNWYMDAEDPNSSSPPYSGRAFSFGLLSIGKAALMRKSDSNLVATRRAIFLSILQNIPSDIASTELKKAFLALLWLDNEGSFEVLRTQVECASAICDKAPSAISNMTDYDFIKPIIFSIWHHLRHSSVHNHQDAVELLWRVQAAGFKDIELIIAEFIASADTYTAKVDVCARLNVVWVHSAHRTDITQVLHRPIELVLDFCRSEELAVRGIARDWLAKLGVLARGILELLIDEVAASPVLRKAVPERFKQVTIDVSRCSEEDDVPLLTYAVESLLLVCQAIDQAVLENTVTKEFVIDGVETGAQTYITALQNVCIRLLRLLPETGAGARSSAEVVQVHCAALELVEHLLPRQHTSPLIDILSKILYVNIHLQNLPIQAALINTLGICLKSNNPSASRRRLSSSSLRSFDFARASVIPAQSVSASSLGDESQAILIQSLVDALSMPALRSSLDQWITFLEIFVSATGKSFIHAMLPLVDRICQQTELAMIQMGDSVNNGASPFTLADIRAFLRGLNLLISEGYRFLQSELATKNVGSKLATDGGFLSNVVSGVFSVEAPVQINESTVEPLTSMCLQHTVRTAASMWKWAIQSNTPLVAQNLTADSENLLLNCYSMNANETMEALFNIWAGKPTPEFLRLTQLLEAPRPKVLLNILIETIHLQASSGTTGSASKSPMTASTFINFLITFIKAEHANKTAATWPELAKFLRDILTHTSSYRTCSPDLLRLGLAINDNLMRTSLYEQKKYRKEMQEFVQKQISAALSITVRVEHHAIAERPSTPMSTDRDSTKARANGTSVSMAPNVMHLFVNEVIPKLPLVFVEADKILAVSNGIMSQAITYGLHSRTGGNEVLELLVALTKIPATQKSWKKEVFDVFTENSFFRTRIGLVKNWKLIMQAVIENDKVRTEEIIGRITAASAPTALFVSREQENINKQMNLRRAAFMLLCSSNDAYLTSLPSLENKVKEVARVTRTEYVLRGELYMFFRAMLLRFSSVHLGRLLQHFLFDMQFLFNSFLEEASATATKEQTRAFAEACKLLDTLIVVSPTGFQLHEWVFLRDTIEAVFPPIDRQSIALTDMLARTSITSSPPSSSCGPPSLSDNVLADLSRRQAKRAPLIAAKTINDIGDLRPFLSYVSLHAYESSLAMEKPDLETCEMYLLRDMFE